MKKLLLSLALIVSIGTIKAQNIYNYGFSGVTADLTTAGWTRTNQSTVTAPTPASTTLWSISSFTPVVVSATVRQLPFGDAVIPVGGNCPAPLGQSGGTNSFALVNYTSTSSTLASGATISNWLISPIKTVNNGDVVTFYARRGKVPGSAGAGFADRLQLRISTDGAFTTDPTTGPTDTGSYAIVAADVNPTLAAAGFPGVWTQYTYTMTGLTGPTDCKFAFRYFVTDGGTNGANSDIIGIDTFSIDTPEACSPPTALTATMTNASGSTISWTAPTTAPANGYEYYYSTTNTAPTAATVPLGTTGAGITTKMLTGLTTGLNYYVWVRSVCSGTVTSSWSPAPATFNTTAVPGCAALATPADLATNVTVTYSNNATTPTERENSFTLSWTAPTTGGVPTGYNIYLGASATTLVLLNTTPFVGTSVNITGVEHNTTYFWNILPVNVGGVATGCAPHSFTTSAVPVGCMNGALYPSATFTPATCDGVTVNQIVTDAFAGEYSNVNVIVGQSYTFRSSVATDFISVSTDAGITAAAGGTTPLTWTATASGVVRFYINKLNCGTEGTNRVRSVVCSTVLATDTFSYANFKSFPNPIKDVLNLSYDKDITNVSVINFLGQEVLTSKVNNTNTKIDMSGLTTGAYMVKVTSDNEVKTIKVIKE
jgi:Secretion system C-terminal sorting domain/Fibronectin type III domain